jgi:cytochrome c
MSVKKLRAAPEIGLGICGAILAAGFATAQISPPPAKPPEGAALFKQQCATCHTTNLSDPQRQGPSLFKVMGRQAGKLDGFLYSAGFAQANFAWDEARLDAWLTNPQGVISTAVMAYRQPKPEIRAAIIAYLRELD